MPPPSLQIYLRHCVIVIFDLLTPIFDCCMPLQHRPLMPIGIKIASFCKYYIHRFVSRWTNRQLENNMHPPASLAWQGIKPRITHCFIDILWNAYVAGNMAYMDAMPDLMSETVSMGTLGKQAEYDRRRRRKYVGIFFEIQWQYFNLIQECKVL